MTDQIWSSPLGRELDTTPLPARTDSPRIVACLNVWNDVNALQATLPTWQRFVSRIIAVDGAYEQTGHELSTDGTREYLQSLPHVTLIDAAGLSQCEKRSRYLRAGQDGEYLFVVDADESVLGGTALSLLPECDIGWVQIQSSMYNRQYGQPRIFKWRPGLAYRGRHHWIYEGDRLFCTHQYGGAGYAHHPVPMTLHNQRQLGRSSQRMDVKHSHHAREISSERVLSAIPESTMSDSKLAKREALRIVHYAFRDDGLAPSRLHTALNRTTPHSSIFVKQRPGPFGVLDQYTLPTHQARVDQAVTTADVIHFHGQMGLVRGLRSDTARVFHHHGTLFRNSADKFMADAKQVGALVLLSNLELFSWTGGAPAFFLPNVMPIARYRRLRELNQKPFDGSSPFRVAHSPSKPEKKGTDEFLRVCEHLQSKGLPIEPVIIHDQLHRDSLWLKSTCHASFDSFWLGLQCSGLEAASMGLPVIAGDETVAQRYREQFGAVPYTFANDEGALEHALERYVTDEAFRTTEARRVATYVLNTHDEAPASLRYLDLLDTAFDWRTKPRVPSRFASAIPTTKRLTRP